LFKVSVRVFKGFIYEILFPAYGMEPTGWRRGFTEEED
jgi:hypothetical protein